MKAGRIIRNTLVGMAATVVLALVGLQIALRPRVLTGMVNRVADGLVDGNVAFREVKAHVIKSFPFLHLEAEDLSVTYPSPLAENQTDTLASLRRLDLSLDYLALARGQYHIRHLELIRPRLFYHQYDSTLSNLDIVLRKRAKTESSAPAPLPDISVHRVSLKDRPLLLVILPGDSLAVRMDGLEASFKENRLELEAQANTYLRTASFGRLKVPVRVEADASLPETAPGELAVEVHRLRLGLSSLGLEGAGTFHRGADGVMDMDLDASIPDCPLGDLMKEYRNNIPALNKVDTDARIHLQASAKGRWGNGQTPLLDARLNVPEATVDYEGLGRKGRLAVDATVTTDDFKQVHADVEKLLLDIAGARIRLSGFVRDVLGKDPLLSLEGRIHARVDSITRAFVPKADLEATGELDAQLNGRARLSQLSARRVGESDIRCDLIARDLYVQMPSDSILARLPQLDASLSTRANSIDRNLQKDARVPALKAEADTLDVNIGSMYVRGGGVRLLMQNSADILRGGKNLTALMGLLKIKHLHLRDEEGLGLSLMDNSETFRVTPATPERPSPWLSLSSDNGRLLLRSGENLFALKGAKVGLSASKHIPRQFPPRDSTQRFRRLRPLRQDDFARSDIRINLGESLRKYVQEWDIEGKLDLAGGRAVLPAFPLRTRVESVKGSFAGDTLKLQSITLRAGESDVTARAQLTGIRRALIGRGRSRLKLKADVRSDYIDANELMRAYAHYAAFADRDSLSVRDSLPEKTEKALLVIPSNLEVDFSLESSGIKYDSLLVGWAAADVAMRQRTLQITNAVASSNMGDIYFEGFYATRSKKEIKAGFNLNLVEITAEKVITLFPAVDSIMPMLTSFGGNLDCTLAATADIDTLMNLVKPSINGILKISGKDLTVKDSREFTRIANMLMFRNRASTHIDQMNVTGIVHDNTLEVFPFVLNVDRYQLAASGIQNLDRKFDYHISVLRSPLLVRFGLNAWGDDFDNIHYGLGKAKYPNAQVPVYSKQLDTVQYSLVAAIHNVFELGVERALRENRTEQYLEPLSVPEGPDRTSGEPSGDVSDLVKQVAGSTRRRQEALKEEIVGLAREAAAKKEENEQL